MQLALLRWFTFGVAGLPTIGLLYSLPFALAVWSSNVSKLISGVIPDHLTSDSIKATVFFGYYISVCFIGLNAAYPINRFAKTIWISLIGFYGLSALCFISPFDVNESLKPALFGVAYFYLVLIFLIGLNLLSSRKSKKSLSERST